MNGEDFSQTSRSDLAAEPGIRFRPDILFLCSQVKQTSQPLIAIDHGPNSKHAFHWAILHFCRLADTIHLVHAVSSLQNQIVYETSRELIEKLAIEAFQVSMVKTVARIVEGDAGKAICKEAERLKPVAVIMGTRGRSLIKSVLQGSVSEYCFHNCKSAPVIIVPGKEAGEESVI